jgi:hypothetical protein
MEIVMKRLFAHQPAHLLPFKDVQKLQFEDKNKSLKLFYNPIIYSKISKLASTVYGSLTEQMTWNSSVLSLYESITSLPSNETKAYYISQLNQYVKEATVEENSAHNLMTVTWYSFNLILYSNEILIASAFKIVDISEEMRKKMNLPPKVVNFTDPETTQAEEAEIEGLFNFFHILALKNDPKKSAVDPKKSPAKVDPKKAAPQAKPDPKKPPGKKVDVPGFYLSLISEEEVPIVTKQKKKPLLSNGWSLERKHQEAKYSTLLFDMVREHIVSSIDKWVMLFS